MSKEINRVDLMNARLERALALQAMEDNPLTADEVAMFKMFEREGWSEDQRRAYILEKLADASDTPLAAE